MDHIEQKLNQNFSYKLDIRITPNKESGKMKDGNLSNSYRLTEYYDSVSGLTMRFKGVQGKNDNQFIFRPVDEFDEFYGMGNELPTFPLHWVFNFLFSIE